MARVVGIGGVFFRARDPDALREWYVEHLGIEPEDHGGAVHWLTGFIRYLDCDPACGPRSDWIDRAFSLHDTNQQNGRIALRRDLRTKRQKK